MLRHLGSIVLLASLAGCSSPGSGGSSVIDRGACDALIACASELAPESRDEFVATYGEGGTCWTGGPMQWAACRDACRGSLESLNLAG